MHHISLAPLFLRLQMIVLPFAQYNIRTDFEPQTKGSTQIP